jgi:hypothetical protein
VLAATPRLGHHLGGIVQEREEATVKRAALVIAGVVILLSAAPFVAAESVVFGKSSDVNFLAGGALAVSIPNGEFADQVGSGFGANMNAGWVTPGRAFALRGDLDFFVYGSETQRVPLSETLQLISVDLTTTNWFGSFRFGPQLMAPAGPIRPYAKAQLGLSYFATTSDVEGSNNTEPFASSTNYSDFTWTYALGGGVYIPLRTGRRGTLALDLGATYIHNGSVSYLAEGDIYQTSRGVVMNPRHSQANVVAVQVGIAFIP